MKRWGVGILGVALATLIGCSGTTPSASQAPTPADGPAQAAQADQPAPPALALPPASALTPANGAVVPPPMAMGPLATAEQGDVVMIKGKPYSRAKIIAISEAARAERAEGSRYGLQQAGYRANPWTLGAYVYTFGTPAVPDEVAWWFGGEGAMTQTGKYVPDNPAYLDTIENKMIYHVLTLNYKVPDDQVLVLHNTRVYYYSTNVRLPRRWPRWAEWWWGYWLGSGIVLPRPEELPADVQTAYSDYWWLGNYTPTNRGSQIHMVFGPGQNVPMSFGFWRFKDHHMYPIIEGNTLHTNIVSSAFLAPK